MATTTDPAMLAAQYEGLVRHVTRRFRGTLPPGSPSDDLAQECRAAVYRAARGFDSGRAVGFMSYAYPSAVRAAARHIQAEWAHGFHSVPRRGGPRVVSEVKGAGGRLIPATDSVAQRPALTVRWAAARWEELLGCLDSRERVVVLSRVGGELTTAAVGGLLGVSASRVDQLWHRALKKLRTAHPTLVEEFTR